VADKRLDMISDVDMTVSVELGRTDKLFKEILDMKPGTVIELNTTTGDRIDFLVNKKLVAKGEVMVLDGKYALRVTDIVGNVSDVVKEALERKARFGDQD
jgi:flagellar motor switch protein FliN